MRNILYLTYDFKNSKTILVDRKGCVHTSNDTPVRLLKKACWQYGSGYDGAKDSFRYLTGAKRKIPICISVMYRIIFIPLYGETSHQSLYIQYDRIEKVERLEKGCRILFKDGISLKVDCDARRVYHQLKRCSLYLDKVLNPEENF